jgi:hypothetical protein
MNRLLIVLLLGLHAAAAFAQTQVPPTGVRAPGLYVQVLDGAINISNSGGSQNFSAGQFGFTASIKQPPVVVPANPGMQFTPPPAFNTSATAVNGSTNAKSGTVDCVVR